MQPDRTAATTLVPCFVCGKKLERVSDSPMQPYGAVMCRTTGNYGSRVLDPGFVDEELVMFLDLNEPTAATAEGGRMDAPTRRRRRKPVAVIARELRARISTLGVTETVDVRVSDLAALLREVGK